MDAQTWLTLAVAVLGTLSTATVAIWTQRRASHDRQRDREQDAAQREADRQHARAIDQAHERQEAATYWRQARLEAYSGFLVAARAEVRDFWRVSTTTGPINWGEATLNGEHGLSAAVSQVTLLGSDQSSQLAEDFSWALGQMWADLAGRDDEGDGWDSFTVGNRTELKARVRDFELAARADLNTGTPVDDQDFEWPPGAERVVRAWRGVPDQGEEITPSEPVP